MKQLKLDTTLYDVPLTVVGFDYSLSRLRPPSGNDVEMEDVEVGGVSVYAVLDPEVRCLLADRLLKTAVDHWCADAEEAADARREEALAGK